MCIIFASEEIGSERECLYCSFRMLILWWERISTYVIPSIRDSTRSYENGYAMYDYFIRHLCPYEGDHEILQDAQTYRTMAMHCSIEKRLLSSGHVDETAIHYKWPPNSIQEIAVVQFHCFSIQRKLNPSNLLIQKFLRRIQNMSNVFLLCCILC